MVVDVVEVVDVVDVGVVVVAEDVIVAVGVVEVMIGGKPGQETLRSLLVPFDVKVRKPGWLLVIWVLIQFWYWDTLV